MDQNVKTILTKNEKLPATDHGKPVSTQMDFLRRTIAQPKAVIGLVLMAFFILMALFAHLIAPYDPSAYVGLPHQPPSAQFWFGTTGQGQDVQMAQALPALWADPQEFPAPGQTVAAQAHAIQGQPEERPTHPVLGRNRGDMRVMMLDRDGRQPAPRGERRGKAGAVKVRMQVVRHHCRLHIERAQ